MNRQGLDVRWIEPSAPPDAFPDPSIALDDPNGLLAIGGDLSVARLLAAYRRGVFPWFSAGQPILWWTPDPRAVMLPAEFRLSRSLRKAMRRDELSVSIDQDFAAVVAGCADREHDTGTWITAEMSTAYCELHAAGHAHSIEVWRGDDLVGGVYGVNIGLVFFGESMFSRESNGSKIALARLMHHCRSSGIELLDCQIASAHLASLGSREISRTEFNAGLERLTGFPAPETWHSDKTATSQFVGPNL